MSNTVLVSNTAFGPSIRAHREQFAGFSLRSFARRIDRTPSWTSKMERGLEMPGPDTLAKIADALGVTRDSVFQAAGVIEPEVYRAVAKNYVVLGPILRVFVGAREQSQASAEAHTDPASSFYVKEVDNATS